MTKIRKKKPRSGKFIVLEGLDGAGTTTQSNLLQQYFEAQKWPVITTSEPTQGPMGVILRLLLSKRLTFGSPTKKIPQKEYLSNSAIALLFAADRLDHLQDVILPKLNDGVIVICDRYYFSNYAYQMNAERSNFEWLQTINEQCIVPDLTIFLNTSLSVCAKRRNSNRWYQDLYEKTEILERVAQNYEYVFDSLKEKCRIEIIDGTPSEKVVFNEILTAIHNNFPEMFPGDLPLFPLQ